MIDLTGLQYSQKNNKILLEFILRDKTYEGTLNFKIIDSVFGIIFYDVSMHINAGEEYWMSTQSPFSKVTELQVFKDKKLIHKIKLNYLGEGNIDLSFLEKIPFIYKYKNYTIHAGTFIEIFYDEMYSNNLVEVESGDVVVDIGANMGLFAHYALKDNPSKIYCCEPSSKCFSLLQDVFKKDKTISLHNYAISDRNGIDNLSIINEGDDFNGLNFLRSNPRCGDNHVFDQKEFCTESVNTITFKDFIIDNNIQKIDVLKIDCEGGEYYIFVDENKEYIKNNVRKIMLEFHGDPAHFIDFFNSTGFEYQLGSHEEKLGMIFAKNKNLYA